MFGLSLHGQHAFSGEVPCGIFDDPKLVAELKEACATIKKATIFASMMFYRLFHHKK